MLAGERVCLGDALAPSLLRARLGRTEVSGLAQHQLEFALTRHRLAPLIDSRRANPEEFRDSRHGAEVINYALLSEHGRNCKHAYRASVKHAYRDSMDTGAMSLGERIKKRREQLGVSVADLAAACGVSKPAVYQWESGDTKGLKPENLVLTADKLRTYTKWLVFGTGPENRPTFRDELAPDEEELIRHVREIPADLQSVVTALARSLHDQQFGDKTG